MIFVHTALRSPEHKYGNDDVTPLEQKVSDDVSRHKQNVAKEEDQVNTGPVLGLHPANKRRRYKVTPSLIGWVRT